MVGKHSSVGVGRVVFSFMTSSDVRVVLSATSDGTPSPTVMAHLKNKKKDIIFSLAVDTRERNLIGCSVTLYRVGDN